MEVDDRVRLAIENAVAASRWRIAARFEGPENRARYMRHAMQRGSAATALLNEIARTTEGEPRRPRLARSGPGGLISRRSQAE